MMLKHLLPIALVCLTVSCSSNEKPTPPAKKVEKVVEKPKKQYDPSSVVSRTEEFFDWYLENNRELYKMRSSCIGAENGYHALDKKKLNAYTAWLKKTNFFSQAFIDAEFNRWSTECADEMRQIARRKQKLEGPPPCVFEGDIFLLIQDRPDKEMIEALSFSVKNQTDSSAVVEYDNRSALTWSSKDGSWKIDTWPN